MKSPDLDPELTPSPLESVANWDSRASVPLARAYMRVGDKGALDGFDAMALSNPVAVEMLKDRDLSETPNVEYLATLPDGTLGKEFERYLTGYDASPTTHEILQLPSLLKTFSASSEPSRSETARTEPSSAPSPTMPSSAQCLSPVFGRAFFVKLCGNATRANSR